MGYPHEILNPRVSVRVFPEEISIWIGGLSKLPSPVWMGIMQSIEARIEQKVEDGGIHPFSCLTAWAGTSHLIVSCPWAGDYTSATPALRPRDWIIALTSQLANSRLGDFSASIIALCQFFIIINILIYVPDIYISPVGSVYLDILILYPVILLFHLYIYIWLQSGEWIREDKRIARRAARSLWLPRWERMVTWIWWWDEWSMISSV